MTEPRSRSPGYFSFSLFSTSKLFGSSRRCLNSIIPASLAWSDGWDRNSAKDLFTVRGFVEYFNEPVSSKYPNGFKDPNPSSKMSFVDSTPGYQSRGNTFTTCGSLDFCFQPGLSEHTRRAGTLLGTQCPLARAYDSRVNLL